MSEKELSLDKRSGREYCGEVKSIQVSFPKERFLWFFG
jgi:hypothetical protein